MSWNQTPCSRAVSSNCLNLRVTCKIEGLPLEPEGIFWIKRTQNGNIPHSPQFTILSLFCFVYFDPLFCIISEKRGIQISVEFDLIMLVLFYPLARENKIGCLPLILIRKLEICVLDFLLISAHSPMLGFVSSILDL